MKVKLKANAKHIHLKQDGTRVQPGEEFELTEQQIAMLVDKLELPAGYIPKPMTAADDYVDPLTGQANRLGPTGTLAREDEATRGLRDQQAKAEMEKHIRDKAAHETTDARPMMGRK